MNSMIRQLDPDSLLTRKWIHVKVPSAPTVGAVEDSTVQNHLKDLDARLRALTPTGKVLREAAKSGEQGAAFLVQREDLSDGKGVLTLFVAEIPKDRDGGRQALRIIEEAGFHVRPEVEDPKQNTRTLCFNGSLARLRRRHVQATFGIQCIS